MQLPVVVLATGAGAAAARIWLQPELRKLRLLWLDG